ncbi:MAG: hypothetical protein RIQ60_4525 [Pseudomonadota bacterium]
MSGQVDRMLWQAMLRPVVWGGSDNRSGMAQFAMYEVLWLRPSVQ